jgi:thiamine-phosphate pyrophosphorylase
VPSPAFDFYLISDRHQTRGRDLLWVLEQALDAGVGAVQLREKDLGGKSLFELAASTRGLCDRYGAALFVNDRIDVARAVGADGVQLGNSSIPIDVAKKLLAPGQSIGASTHSLLEAENARQSGADFLLFGPVYFTPSKAPFGAPQGLTALRKIVENVPLPVYAIGGLSADNAAEVMRLGARGIALISAVMSAPDPRAAADSIRRSMQR